MITLSKPIKTLCITLLLLFILVHLVGQFTGLGEGGRSALLLAYQFAEVWQGKEYWRILTAPWIHADAFSLLINLLVIAFLGGELERLWGYRKFIFYYLVCAYLPLLFFVFLDLGFLKGAGGPFLGATSGIYGLLMAYGILFAERQMLFMMVIPMKAKHFIWILVGVDLLTAVSGGRTLSLTCAHLSGLGFGLLTLLGMAKWRALSRNRGERAGPKNEGKSKSAGHLRLVQTNPDQEKDKPSTSAGSKGDGDSGDPTTWH